MYASAAQALASQDAREWATALVNAAQTKEAARRESLAASRVSRAEGEVTSAPRVEPEVAQQLRLEAAREFDAQGRGEVEGKVTSLVENEGGELGRGKRARWTIISETQIEADFKKATRKLALSDRWTTRSLPLSLSLSLHSRFYAQLKFHLKALKFRLLICVRVK